MVVAIDPALLAADASRASLLPLIVKHRVTNVLQVILFAYFRLVARQIDI
jgi:hypothetical protein